MLPYPTYEYEKQWLVTLGFLRTKTLYSASSRPLSSFSVVLILRQILGWLPDTTEIV
jgi:hypothetical protein